MKTENLIELIVQDSAPRWSFGRIVWHATVYGVIAAAGVFFLGVGFRSDISSALRSVRFLFKVLVALTLAVGAIGAVFRIGRPDAALERWSWVLAVVPAVLVCAVGLELVAVPEASWMGYLVGHNARFCLTLIPLLAIGPLIFLIMALRHGATTKPKLAGALAGLSASGIAATFYTFNCTDDSPLFVATWYSIATFIVVVAGYFAGDRLLRW